MTLRNDILSLLGDYHTLTARDVVAFTGRDRGAVWSALRVLRRNGLVQNAPGRRKPGVRLWQLKEGETVLALSRKRGEKIVIDGGIEVVVLEIAKGRVRLGISAPRDVQILREELVRVRITAHDTGTGSSPARGRAGDGEGAVQAP